MEDNNSTISQKSTATLNGDHANSSKAPQIKARWAWSRPWRIIATGLGSGLSPKMPGTAGTLWAWVVYKNVFYGISSSTLLTMVSYSCIIALWAIWLTTKELEQTDHPAIVIDEIVAFWIILWIISPIDSLLFEGIAFILFRYFDITKPGIVRLAEWNNSLGVLMDDLVAAMFTIIALAGIWYYFNL